MACVSVPRDKGARTERALSLLLACALTLDLTGCASRGFHPTPIADLSSGNESLAGKALRLTTTTGVVVFVQPTVALPYVEGVAEPGMGQVELDLETLRAAREFGPGWKKVLRPEVPLTREGLAGDGKQRRIEFDTPEGSVRLVVLRVSETAVWGMPRGGKGRSRVDVREVTKVEIGNPSSSTDNPHTLALFVAFVVVGLAILMAVGAHSFGEGGNGGGGSFEW